MATKAGKIIGGVLIFGTGFILTRYFWKQYRLLYDSCIKFAGVGKFKASLSNIDMSIKVAYLNKSEISLEVTRQIYKLYVNDILVSTITSLDVAYVPPMDKALLTLDVSFRPKDLIDAGMKNIEDILFHQDNVMIKLSCELKVKAGILSTTIPFDYTDTLANYLKPTTTAVEC